MRIILMILILLHIPGIAAAQLTFVQKAEISGQYWAAAIMADEFSKSKCGKQYKIDPVLSDAELAKREIKQKFPASMTSEIDETFDKKNESNQREFFRGFFAKAYPNQCKQVAEAFWTMHTESINRWRTFR